MGYVHGKKVVCLYAMDDFNCDPILGRRERRMTGKVTQSISVALWVTGARDFDPTKFTSQIKIEPTRIWRCRPNIAASHPELDRVSWVYEMENIATCEYSKALQQLFDLFSPKKSQLVQSVGQLNLTTSVHLVPHGELRSFVPTVTPEMVREIAAISASWSFMAITFQLSPIPMEVIVLPHDPSWVDMFSIESRLILSAFGANAIAAHHIGSTAIPAIVAKPVVDMLIVVNDIEVVDACNVEMEKLGYEAMGEFGIPSRRYFRKDNDTGKRTYHVHVFAQGSKQVDRHLAFRDFMNAHPDWAGRYSDLKCELVAKHPNSIEAYVDGKNDFIKQVDAMAETWRFELTGEQTDELK